MNWRRMLDRLAMNVGYTSISLLILMTLFNDVVKFIGFIAAL